jgi:hypothetical protein
MCPYTGVGADRQIRRAVAARIMPAGGIGDRAGGGGADADGCGRMMRGWSEEEETTVWRRFLRNCYGIFVNRFREGCGHKYLMSDGRYFAKRAGRLVYPSDRHLPRLPCIASDTAHC